MLRSAPGHAALRAAESSDDDSSGESVPVRGTARRGAAGAAGPTQRSGAATGGGLRAAYPTRTMDGAAHRVGASAAVLAEEAEIGADADLMRTSPPQNGNASRTAPANAASAQPVGMYDPVYGVPRGFSAAHSFRNPAAHASAAPPPAEDDGASPDVLVRRKQMIASAQPDDSSEASTPLGAGASTSTFGRTQYLLRPAVRGRMTTCYVTRERGWIGHFPKFLMFSTAGDEFLLSARRKKKSKTSYYLLSLDRNDVSKGDDVYLGKLRSNYVGTEFVLYDNGTKDPQKVASAKEAELDDHRVEMHGKGKAAAHQHAIRELAAVRFKQTALTSSGGPRALTAIVPVDPDTSAPLAEGRQLGGEETLVESYLKSKTGEPRCPVIALKNKKPEWNTEINAHVLNFHGRVTEASTKNFQLCMSKRDDFEKDDVDGSVVLQFGKCGNNTFALDFAWPLSPLQAFAIALSSIDSKLCYVL